VCIPGDGIIFVVDDAVVSVAAVDNPGLSTDEARKCYTANTVVSYLTHFVIHRCPKRHPIITVALCNRADYYIFALWFLPYFFSFFLAKS